MIWQKMQPLTTTLIPRYAVAMGRFDDRATQPQRGPADMLRWKFGAKNRPDAGGKRLGLDAGHDGDSQENGYPGDHDTERQRG